MDMKEYYARGNVSVMKGKGVTRAKRSWRDRERKGRSRWKDGSEGEGVGK